MHITSRILAATALSVFSILSVAGTSYASNNIPQVSITRVDSVSDNAFKANLENISVNDAATVQSSIRGDAGLTDTLREKNVQFNNIVKIDRFDNGSAAVYVR